MAETEAVLLKRFAGSGDARAFAEIIRRHAGLVYGAALRILADVDRASDVAQETFLQLAKDAGSVTGSLPGWLHRVATHKAIDQRRQEASRRRRERQYAVAEKPHAELTEWKDVSPHVDVALRELEPQLREVLILHFLEGRTTREIAAARNISQATISRRIGAGVEQLRAKLRRRGILVAVGALSALLGDNAVQAAPLPLLAELGKMAIVGGATAGAAGTGAGTVTTGVLTAVKTKVVAVAAVAVISAGSAVTYYELTKSPPAPTGVTSADVPGGFAPPLNLPQAETQWDLPAVAYQNRLHGDDRDALAPQESAAVKYGGVMGSLMGVSAPPPSDLRDRLIGPTADVDSRTADEPSDPNRSNDPNDGDPNSSRQP